MFKLVVPPSCWRVVGVGGRMDGGGGGGDLVCLTPFEI